jgi:phage shock protein E
MYSILITAVLASASFLFADAKRTGHWIDVRTPEEYAAGHLQGAVNIPFNEIAERIDEVTTDKNAEIHVYCASGGRSGIAREDLLELGYKNVINDGGYEDLKE